MNGPGAGIQVTVCECQNQLEVYIIIGNYLPLQLPAASISIVEPSKFK